MKLTAAQLQLIIEAGMNRRNFLKFLGKTAAATYGAPLGSLDLGQLSNSLTPEIAKWIKTYKNYLKKNNVTENEFIGEYLELLDYHTKNPNIPMDAYKGYLANSVINDINSSNKNKHFKTMMDLIDTITMGHDTPLETLFTPLLNLTMSKLGPQKFASTILNIDGTYIDDYYLGTFAEFINHSPALKNYIQSKGINANEWIKKYNTPGSNADIEMLEQSGLINKKQLEVTKAHRNKIKANWHKTRNQHDKKPQNLTHLQPEAGYEKQSQLDPRSSRPAQAYQPFESKLKQKLHTI